MQPLPSINWQGIDSIDAVMAAVLSELSLLRREMICSEWEPDDFAQLDRNIVHIKMGFERAERICLSE
jgi:hypothetical protein